MVGSLVAAAAGLALGCAHGGHLDPRIADASLLPHNFLPGETMQFAIRIGPVTVGSATLAVSALGAAAAPIDAGGPQSLVVRSRITSGGISDLIMEVDDETTSLVTGDARPLRTTTTARYGRHRYTSEATFEQEGTNANRVSVAFIAAPKPPIAIRIAAPPGTQPHDMHTAMAQLRPWIGDQGERKTLWVIGGRRLWKTEVTWRGAETISTRFGERGAIRIDGTAWRHRSPGVAEKARPERRFSVWLSDDADRVPLRVEAVTELASVVVELEDYQR